MTDEQIIDDFRRCLDSLCTICPNMNCTDAILNLTFDLINRKTRQLEEAKAEIERLKRGVTFTFTIEDFESIKETVISSLDNKIKSEAIKEFAERLKNKIWYSGWCNLERTITPEIITNLVKEMTEE